MKIFGYELTITKIAAEAKKTNVRIHPQSELKTNYEPAIKLLRAMHNTVRSRFIAAIRLENKDKATTRITSMSSAYLIILTVIPYFLDVNKQVEDHLNLISVAFSIVILVFSILQYSSSFIVNAEQHHRSGLEINEIIRKFISDGPAMDKDLYEKYSDSYSSVLQKYSINHEPIDFVGLQIERPQDFPWNSSFKIFRMSAIRFISLNYYTFFTYIVTGVFLWIVFCYAMNYKISLPF